MSVTMNALLEKARGQTTAVLSAGTEGFKRTQSVMADFVKTDKGALAVFGGLTLGAYVTIKGMFGDDEYHPPVPPIGSNTAHRAPPPILGPSSGHQGTPAMIAPSPARLSPAHPAPVPRRGLARTYDKPTSSRLGGMGANASSMNIRDHADPVSQHIVERRMRQVSRSDFVR